MKRRNCRHLRKRMSRPAERKRQIMRKEAQKLAKYPLKPLYVYPTRLREARKRGAYMCVMNIDEVYYCCLYGNNEDEVIIRHIVRDLDYEAELIDLEGNFWNNHIQTQIPPPYTEDGDLIIESARRHFGPADENAPDIELSVPLASSVVRYTELQAEKSVLNQEVKRVDNEMKRLQGRIVAEMGRSCVATATGSDGSYTITYKPVLKSGIDKAGLTRLQAQHPDIYEEYVTVSESRRFYVKRLQETAA